MIEGIPKISVLVITYKQEDIVGRTLDSLIEQRDYLYEICVSDDCSPDGTWDVLLDYQKRYPDLIKLHRQNPNVGIFENTVYSWTMPSGDVINEIAGDDTTPEGWYKAVVEYILHNNIDWKNDLFCVYGDYKCIYPNGDTIVHKQNAISKYDDAFRLALRGIINGRGCCYSKLILDKFKNFSQGRSHIAENAQDRQLQFFTEKNYYIPQVSNVYYSFIGVSTHIDEEKKKERMQIWPYSIKCFKELGADLKKKDLLFIKHRMNFQEYLYWGKKKSGLLSLWYYLRSFDLKIFLASDSTRGFIFAIRRRLPHKHIINMN